MVIEDQRQQESNKAMDRCTPMIVLVATIVILRFNFFLAEISKLHLTGKGATNHNLLPPRLVYRRIKKA